MTETPKMGQRMPRQNRSERPQDGWPEGGWPEDGRPVSVEAVIAEARRQQGAAIRRLVVSVLTRAARTALSLFGPAFGWQRRQLAEMRIKAAIGERRAHLDDRHHLTPSDLTAAQLFRGDAALGHSATDDSGSSASKRPAQKQIAA